MARGIGIAGVGGIGAAIADRLLAGGHRVHGYRRETSALAEFAAGGGRSAPTLGHLAVECPILVLCLGSGVAMRECLDDLAPYLAPGHTVVSTGTAAVDDVVAAAETVNARDADFVDAPLSGTPGMVRAGQAVFLAGGTVSSVAGVQKVLGRVGRVAHVGGVGDGTRSKYLANALLAINSAATAEVVALAELLGLDRGVFVDAVSGSAASSAAFDIRAPRMATEAFEPAQGPIAGLRGDLDLILAHILEHGEVPPVLAATKALFDDAVARGNGHLDISAIVESRRPERTPGPAGDNAT